LLLFALPIAGNVVCNQKKLRAMRITFLIGLLIVGLISCNKDNDIVPIDSEIENMYDTIKPLVYFPVYPGSFWKYRIIEKQYNISINGNDTTYILEKQDTTFNEITTSSDYILHNYVTSSYYDYDSDIQIKEFSDSVYVPFLNDKPIYGYDKIDYASKPPFGDTTYRKYAFLSETIGYEFLDGWYDSRYLYYGTYNKVVEKTIDVNSDSLIIVYGHYNRELGPEYNLRRNEWRFYYKNIGLKLHFSFDERMRDTVYKEELVEYYINK
jgi:hypothetical protein